MTNLPERTDSLFVGASRAPDKDWRLDCGWQEGLGGVKWRDALTIYYRLAEHEFADRLWEEYLPDLGELIGRGSGETECHC